MKGRPRSEITVVLACTEPGPALEESIRGFASEIGERGEIVVVDSSTDGVAYRLQGMSDVFARMSHSGSGATGRTRPVLRASHGALVEYDQWHPRQPKTDQSSPKIRLLRAPRQNLAPESWRDGLLQSDSSLVAFSTTQMVPRVGWYRAMCDRIEATEAAGVGGPIAPSHHMRRADRAVYLQRYANYLPPLTFGDHFDPPGDNAVYRRDPLMDLESAWSRGFWEVEVHRALRARGEGLIASENAVVEFRGGVRLGSAIRQRWAHARRYGASRSQGRSMPQRLVRAVVGPIVPAVLLSRIAKNLRRRGQPLHPWLSAMPELGLLLSAWSCGEMVGTCSGS